MRFRLANFVSMPRMQKEPDIEHNAVLSNTDSVPERPKSVLSSRVWGIAYPIHLVALGMTVAVLQLNFRKVYFADVGTQGFLGTMDVNEVIKAIQFAAKLHEIFMVASLTAIVSHLTRSCLLGKRGVPLGLISAPFKVGSADYIFSREFFNSITWTHGLFSLGLLLGTIFMLGLGPASAMALAPSLGWWNIADPYSGLDRPIWVSSHPHDIWPQTITRQLHSCHSMDNSTVNCPGDGAHDLKAWAAAKSHTERPANITMLEAVSGARRRLQTQSEDMSNTTMLSYLPYASALDNTHTSGQSLHEYLYSAGPTTLTTTSSHWVTMLLGEFWNYAKDVNLGLINRSARPAFQIDESIPIYEPLVSARCSLYDYSTRIGTQDELLAPFVRNAFGATGITENTWGWQIPSSTWNFSRPMNALNFTWIDLQGLDVNASIGGLFSAPISVRAPNGTYLQESLLVPCTIEARWIASELINDPMSSDIVSDNVSDPLDLAHNAEQDAGEATARFGASPIINITSDWANQLNLPTTRFRLPGDNHSIPNLVEDFVGVDDESIYSLMTGSTSLSEDSKDIAWEVSKELAIVLGLEVADGLSRVNYGTLDMAVIYHQNSTTASRSSLTKQKDITGMLYNRTHAADPLSSMAANGSWYSMQVQRWGYGYGLGTKASHFSVSMLIIYGCIAIAYLVWFNIQNQTRKHSDWSLITHKWSSISELVALAINSPPTPKLDGTCAGIDNKQTWKQIIRVRECEGDHLALFVGERPDEHPRVQRNVQYGALRPDPGRPVPEAQRGDDIGFSRWRMMQSHVR